MLRHVVLFRFRADATVDQLAAVREGLSGLPALIPEIRDYRFGSDLELRPGTWDFAVTADFDDQAGWAVYDAHPEHNRVRSECFAPIVSERAMTQFNL